MVMASSTDIAATTEQGKERQHILCCKPFQRICNDSLIQ